MPIRLNGSTSGYVELAAPAVAGSTVLELPTDSIKPGLVLVAAQSFSAVSAVNFDGCFTSDYENYLILIGVTGSSASDSDITFRLRLAGSDITTASYNADRIVQFGATLVGQDYSGSSALGLVNLSSAGPWSSSELSVFRPAVADETVILAKSYGRNNAGELYHDHRACQHTQATAYDGFSIYVTSGNFTGNIHVYGYRKA